jgi:hypothetical protein
MPDFLVTLALEYFQAKPLRDRTPGTLQGIIDHLSQTHALSPEARRSQRRSMRGERDFPTVFH